MVKTCNTCETHVIIRVPAVIKTWGDAVRRESWGVCHGESTVIRQVLRHWQMDFSAYWTLLAMLRQCFSSGTAANGHTSYKARPSQNWPTITTYDHVQQTFCTRFRRGVLCDRGALVNNNFQIWLLFGWQHSCQPIRSHVRKAALTNINFSMDFS